MRATLGSILLLIWLAGLFLAVRAVVPGPDRSPQGPWTADPAGAVWAAETATVPASVSPPGGEGPAGSIPARARLGPFHTDPERCGGFLRRLFLPARARGIEAREASLAERRLLDYFLDREGKGRPWERVAADPEAVS